MRRSPGARFPEERPRGPWSIKSRVTEMTEAGSGSTGGSTSSGFAASVLPDAGSGFSLEFLRVRRSLLQERRAHSVLS